MDQLEQNRSSESGRSEERRNLLMDLMAQVLASQETRKPIVAVTIATPDWLDMKADRRNLDFFLSRPMSEKAEPLLLGGAAIFERRCPRGATVYTNQAPLYDLISQGRVWPAH